MAYVFSNIQLNRIYWWITFDLFFAEFLSIFVELLRCFYCFANPWFAFYESILIISHSNVICYKQCLYTDKFIGNMNVDCSIHNFQYSLLAELFNECARLMGWWTSVFVGLLLRSRCHNRNGWLTGMWNAKSFW